LIIDEFLTAQAPFKSFYEHTLRKLYSYSNPLLLENNKHTVSLLETL